MPMRAASPTMGIWALASVRSNRGQIFSKKWRMDDTDEPARSHAPLTPEPVLDTGSFLVWELTVWKTLRLRST